MKSTKQIKEEEKTKTKKKSKNNSQTTKINSTMNIIEQREGTRKMHRGENLQRGPHM